MYLLVVGCFRTYLPTPDNELPSLALWYKYYIYEYKHIQPLGLGDYSRVSEFFTSLFSVPAGKFNLSGPQNSYIRVKFAGFPFNLVPSSKWLCSFLHLAQAGI